MPLTCLVVPSGESFSTTGLIVLHKNYLEVYPYDSWQVSLSSYSLKKHANAQQADPAAPAINHALPAHTCALLFWYIFFVQGLEETTTISAARAAPAKGRNPSGRQYAAPATSLGGRPHRQDG